MTKGGIGSGFNTEKKNIKTFDIDCMVTARFNRLLTGPGFKFLPAF